MGSEVGSVKRKRDQVGVFRTDTTVYVSTTGKDTNSGLSESTPFRTISKAFSFLKNYTFLEDADITISVAAGVYNISSTLVMDHPQGDRITLQGASGTVSNINDVSEYTDTTSLSGRVGSRTYQTIRRPLNEGGVYDSGQRYDMMIGHETTNPFPRSTSATGKYVIISPIDSDYNLQAVYNESSVGLGSLNDNTDIKRFEEPNTKMRRFMGFGAQKIKLNTNDIGSNKTLLENRIRNISPYSVTVGPVTSRNQTLPDPRRTDPFVSPHTSVPARYIGTVIKVSGDINGLKIDQSSLTLKDLVFEARDPQTTTSNPVTSSGIVITDGAVCKLDQGVAVANFDVGIRVENKSLLTQTSTTFNPYQSVTNCKTGILITDGSSCVLNGMFVTGCWNDGIIANGHSEADLSSCAVVGCGRNGFISSRNSDVMANRCVSAYNLQNSTVGFSVNTQSGIGFGARLNSNIECVGCYAFRNGYGYYADKNGSLMISSSDSRDNLDYAICSAENSNAIVGPFFHSEADAAGVLVTDCACCKVVVSTFNHTGFDAPSSAAGSCFTVTALGNLSLYDVDADNYAKNCIESMYNGLVISDGLNISEHANTEGDAINATYNSVVRLAGACAGSKPINRFSLQNGFVEINGVEVNE
jgi:hypothetical protein